MAIELIQVGKGQQKNTGSVPIGKDVNMKCLLCKSNLDWSVTRGLVCTNPKCDDELD